MTSQDVEIHLKTLEILRFIAIWGDGESALRRIDALQNELLKIGRGYVNTAGDNDNKCLSTTTADIAETTTGG